MENTRTVVINKDTVVITYYGEFVGERDLSFEYLIALHKALEEHNIGPKLIDYSDFNSFDKSKGFIDAHSVTLEKVNKVWVNEVTVNPLLLSWLHEHVVGDPLHFLKLKLNAVINILHNTIGFSHGNVTKSSLGYRIVDGNFHLLLLDIEDSVPLFLGRYLHCVRSDISDSLPQDYEEMLAEDYTGVF